MRLVRWLIWSGFVALLAVSVPKIAWVFRSYEPTTPTMVAGIDARWLVPFFVAICIDALVLALTYAVSIDRARASQVSMWLFTGVLCTLSYYCNWLYNAMYEPSGAIWGTPFVQVVTPFIVSAMPMFALSYTLILSRIDGKGETLEERANRLESERSARERIQQATVGRWQGAAQATIRGIAAVALSTRVAMRQPTDDTPTVDRQREDNSVVDKQQIGDNTVVAFPAADNKRQRIVDYLVDNPDARVGDVATALSVDKGYVSRVKRSLSEVFVPVDTATPTNNTGNGHKRSKE